MRRCYLCGRTANIERHHVFNGALRKKSDRYGYVVDLCHWCHNEPPDGVHFNQELDNQLKAHFQEIAMEENGWTKQDFIREFGKNYLED